MPKSKHRKGFKKRKAQNRKKKAEAKKAFEHKLTRLYSEQYKEAIMQELEARKAANSETVTELAESESLEGQNLESMSNDNVFAKPKKESK